MQHLKGYTIFKQRFIIIISMLFCCLPAHAQTDSLATGIDKKSFIYAVKDSSSLGLDVYQKDGSSISSKRPCVIFVFGGAFMAGRRDDTVYRKYFYTLAQQGYVVASISYRLGLKGVKHVSVLHTAPLTNAIDMAVDDIYDATNWLIVNASELGIDTSLMVLSGSSAGAVAVLQADFYKRNSLPLTSQLSPSFQYAGVMAFSGAIFSNKGKIKYSTPPAPTLFFYGTRDRIMPYNKIQLFKRGLYGSSYLAKIFKEQGDAYYIYRAENLGHEMAVVPMVTQLPVILDFLDRFVVQKKAFQIDITCKDPDEKPMLTISASKLFKKLQTIKN